MQRSASQRLRIMSWLLVAAACGSEASNDAGGRESATGSVCPTNSTLTYENFAAPFMEKYCTRCHGTDVGDDARMNAPMDLNFESESGILRDLEHIDATAAAGPDASNQSMPPSGETPTLEERRQLGEYLACAAERGTDHDHDEGHEHTGADHAHE